MTPPKTAAIIQPDDRLAALIAELERIDAQLAPLKELENRQRELREAVRAEVLGRYPDFNPKTERIEVPDQALPFIVSCTVTTRLDEKRVKAEQPYVYAYYSVDRKAWTYRRAS